MAAQPIALPSVPAEIKKLIDMVLVGYNRKDLARYNRAFGRDAVVIDGIAPYRWTGPNAQARWFSAAEKWVHDCGVEKETISSNGIFYAAVVGAHAYVVLSATLSFSFKGGAE